MFATRMLSIGAVAMLGATSIATLTRHPQPSLHAAELSADSVAEERSYAVAVATIADSAIHRLDFFPGRAQLRIQAAFVLPSSDQVPFDDLAARGNAATTAIGAALDRFREVRVPADLKALHRELVNALTDANRATANLTMAANACQGSMSSIDRCQVPFTSATSRLAASYNHYLGARAKIGAQIVDTDTHLAEFKK